MLILFCCILLFLRRALTTLAFRKIGFDVCCVFFCVFFLSQFCLTFSDFEVFDAKRLIGRKFADPIVQADIKLWPFKCVAGQGDKPMIIVNAQGEAG